MSRTVEYVLASLAGVLISVGISLWQMAREARAERAERDRARARYEQGPGGVVHERREKD